MQGGTETASFLVAPLCSCNSQFDVLPSLRPVPRPGHQHPSFPGLGQNLPTACSTLFSCPLQSNIHMAVGVDLLTCESWYVFSPVKSLQRIRIVTRVHSTSFKVRQALAQEPLKSSPSCSALLGTLAPPNLLTSPLTGHCPPLRHSPACAHCLECSTPRSLHGWFFPIPKRPSLSLSPLAFLFSLWAYH